MHNPGRWTKFRVNNTIRVFKNIQTLKHSTRHTPSIEIRNQRIADQVFQVSIHLM
eukprot:Awhi_evm1s4726